MKRHLFIYIMIGISLCPSCNIYEIKSTMWSNGNRKAHTEYLKGKKHGRHIEWSETGIKLTDLYYSNDKLDGVGRYWDNNGKLIREIEYLNGKLKTNIEFNNDNSINHIEKQHGDTIFENGWYSIPKYTRGYVNGIENGLWINWYQNGKKAIEGMYKANDLDDSLTLKSENDTMGISSFTFIKPKDGKWLYWYESGSLMREEFYNNGVKIGTWKFFNIEGKIIKEENYENGILIEMEK